MNKTLSHVFKTEKEASDLIEQANKKAAAILKKTDSEIQERAVTKRKEATELIHSTVKKARKEAEAEQKKILQNAKKEKSDFFTGKEKLIDSLTDKIVKLITTPEYLEYIKKV